MAKKLDKWRVDRSVISVVDFRDEPDDLEYWLSKTPLERWEAAEKIRQIVYGYDPSTARLERVIEVIQQPWS
jgi:hypothetical protein